MKKRILIYLISLLALVLVAVGALVGLQISSDRRVEYDYQSDVDSVSSYTRVLKVAGGKDFSPFAYIDENGLPSGHDVELAFAIGREMGYRVDVTLGDWTEMQAGILDGTYDILLTADYSEARSKVMGYSSPVCIDSYVFFGKDGSISMGDIQSLQKLRIAALDGGGATDNYIKPLGLTENTTFYDTQLDAFDSVENGINDVAIAGYIYGSNIIAKEGLNLVQIGNPLYGSAYYFTYRIDNYTIGIQLNAALAALERKGELSRIENKWTTHYQPSLTLKEYVSQNIKNVVTVGLICLIVLFAVIEIFLGKLRRNEKNLLERDRITGLYNMRAFTERMRSAIRKPGDRKFVLVRFDIDNFKAFNNIQGRDAGDRLLKNIGAGIARGKSAPEDVLLSGYLGNDYFVMLMAKGKFTENPDLLHGYIADMIETAFPGYYLEVRMGLCDVDDRNTDPAVYCDRSLTALRSIKDDYYRRWAWFDSSIQRRIDEEKEIAGRMYKALEEGRFVPYFQIQYDYLTKRIHGAEVLSRWVEEDGSIIPPSKFVPVFEKNGFIYEMNKSIWRQTCRCIKQWKAEGIMPPHLSVNISRADIYHSDLVETISDMMSEYDVSMDEFHFEITESAYIENSTLLVDTVGRLKSIGAYIEMDDFGSGYSSLSSLRDMDVDAIKLDMSLIKNNSLEGKDAALLATVVQMGNSMGLELIAEGIETENQADYLHYLGCDILQGYMFSKPLNQTDFEELLRKNI